MMSIKILINLPLLLVFISTVFSQNKTTIFYQSLEWSPDNKTICFAAIIKDSGKYDKTKWEIYSVNADGSNLKRLTKNTPSKESYPAWRRDDKKILFTSDRDGNYELYHMNPDGTQQERLTNTPGNELNPSYSPDGKKITYFYEKGDHHDQVYVADADVTNAVNICNDTLNNIYPSWSPTGKKIIYAAAR